MTEDPRDYTRAQPQQVTLPDAVMAGIKAITTSADVDPGKAYIAVVFAAIGYAFYERQAEIDPVTIAIPEAQWQEICQLLIDMPKAGSDIDRVNYGLSWMNQGPSSYKPEPLNGYIALYRGQRFEVYAKTTFAAQLKAAEHFKAKKAHEVSVHLAEIDGEPYTHTAVD